MSPDVHESWFDISDAGWRLQQSSRPLAALLREALQNAFDQPAAHVSLSIGSERIVIEDDSPIGFDDPRQAYTIFLSNKGDQPSLRGRYGRGLKELLACADKAAIHTVGFDLLFDDRGRKLRKSRRRRGSEIVIERHTSAEAIARAVADLGVLIPPAGVSVRLNGRKVARPRRFAELSGCELDTVVYDEGVERIVRHRATITLYRPRRRDPAPHLFEMGLPVQPLGTPWHVNVGQRIPLRAGRDRVSTAYRLQLLATLFESLIHQKLPLEALKRDWIFEVLARCEVSTDALRAYVQRALPPDAVLPSSEMTDDRARQLGAHVLDGRTLSASQVARLAQVLDRSDQFVARQSQHQAAVRALRPAEQRALGLYGHLAKRLLGRAVQLHVYHATPSPTGRVDSATFDRRHWRLGINLDGELDLDHPLTPESLGILLHELAHAECETHGPEFVAALERVAGRAALLMAREGDTLAATYGLQLDEHKTRAAQPAAARERPAGLQLDEHKTRATQPAAAREPAAGLQLDEHETRATPPAAAREPAAAPERLSVSAGASHWTDAGSKVPK